QWIRLDENGDNRLKIGRSHGNKDGGGGEQLEVWAEELSSGKIKLYNHSGDENDAFQLGDKLGLSGKYPVLNYPRYRKIAQEFQPYLLNGLAIEIVGKTDSSFLVKVRTDQWTVSEDVFWCGNMLLSSEIALAGDFLTLAKKKTLTLDLGGTPDRSAVHPKTGTLTNPTLMKIQANRGIRLAKKSKLIVENHSILKLTANARLDILKGAELIIRKGGKLILEDQSQLILRKKGKLSIIDGGEYILMPQARILTAPKAKVTGLRDDLPSAKFE
ncbi:MAG: hypothetical protein AAF655_20115, partial [Bacteroidota bacterium]